MQVIQKVALKKNDKFLILLRSEIEDPMPLHWDFPGGKLEKGEDPLDGIKREAKEETGLDIKNCKLDSKHTIMIHGRPHLFRIYTAEIASKNKKIKLSSEHEEYRWASLKEISKLKVNTFLIYYLDI